MKQTHATKKNELKPKWHHIDANNKVLGKIATEISQLLIGKGKVDYVPYLQCGDQVVVTNAKGVVLTGNKEEKKIYYTHSGYVGNIRAKKASQIRAKNPSTLITKAVSGMLPKNKLRKERMRHLHVFNDTKHPHDAQLKEKNA